jgi:hypothetical protein
MGFVLHLETLLVMRHNSSVKSLRLHWRTQSVMLLNKPIVEKMHSKNGANL